MACGLSGIISQNKAKNKPVMIKLAIGVITKKISWNLAEFKGQTICLLVYIRLTRPLISFVKHE